jgi:flagella basal body P-ring formation protein FlgA
MRKAGLDGAAAGRVCIVRLGSAVAPAQVRAAVRLAVEAEQREGRRLEWEVLDYDHSPLPRGELKLARVPMSATPPIRPAGASLWPGRWIYDAGRKSSPFWVRVRLVCRERRVVLARALPARALLSAADLKLEADSACAAQPPPLSGLDAAIGRRLRRSLPAGARLTAACFEPRYLVERGQTVRVEAEVAGARVTITGTANTPGGLGDKVSIRPLSRGRLLQGRVSGLATVTTTGTITP